jgi:hypothetical protein
MKQKETKTKKPETTGNPLKTKKRTKKIINNCKISKKDFRENPTVEKFYRTIYEYKLREDAYKTAIKIQLSHLLKENPNN